MAKNATDTAKDAQDTYFSFTNEVPEQVWYWAAMGSIAASLIFKLSGKDNWALFVGQWPPTFLILAVFHKVLRPKS